MPPISARPLIFDQLENIIKLVKDRRRPVQFIFAGKAHPRDDEGKKFIQRIIHLSKYSELKGHLVFIENYDVHVARSMVSGCDVWLNNPRRPLEASGTSGQKAGCHGCLNLSIMDGWWREGYDGTNGFAIGGDEHPASVEAQDKTGQRQSLQGPDRGGHSQPFTIGTTGVSRANGFKKSAAPWSRWSRASTPGAWCRITPASIICRNELRSGYRA